MGTFKLRCGKFFFSVCMASLLAAYMTAGQENSAEGWAKITVIQKKGGRIDWSADGGLIAFDRLDAGGRYAVFTMKPDGSGVKPVTGRFPEFRGRDAGQPAWHPLRRYLVFQAEKKEHPAVSFRYLTSPGAGHFNDLRVWDALKDTVHPLVIVPDGRDHGILHAHFSPDGTMLSWTQMHKRANIFNRGQEFGYWKLYVGDFVTEEGRPALRNIRAIEPLGEAFYENHGFSPDGYLLIFTSNGRRMGESAYKAEDIFTYCLKTAEVKCLTDSGYNEHALFSPDGKWIVWMTNMGKSGSDPSVERAGTDYWAMRPDGSDKRRITYFNEKGHPHSSGRPVIAADLSWRPDSRAFAAYCKTGLIETSGGVEERILLVEPEW